MAWFGRCLMLSEVAISKLADIKALDKELIKCDGCLRLKLWREEVAVTKRRAYQDETYWGKPVPGFGPVDDVAARRTR